MLSIGECAPDFALNAANQFDHAGNPKKFELKDLIRSGPLVLEFLRGTW